MAEIPVAFASGTLSASTSTGEQSLTTVAQPGTYTLHADLANASTGDVVELRAYQKILPTGTMRTAQKMTFYGPQSTDDTIKVTLPWGNDISTTSSSTGLQFTVAHLTGSTGFTMDWKVLQY